MTQPGDSNSNDHLLQFLQEANEEQETNQEPIIPGPSLANRRFFVIDAPPIFLPSSENRTPDPETGTPPVDRTEAIGILHERHVHSVGDSFATCARAAGGFCGAVTRLVTTLLIAGIGTLERAWTASRGALGACLTLAHQSWRKSASLRVGASSRVPALGMSVAPIGFIGGIALGALGMWLFSASAPPLQVTTADARTTPVVVESVSATPAYDGTLSRANVTEAPVKPTEVVLAVSPQVLPAGPSQVAPAVPSQVVPAAPSQVVPAVPSRVVPTAPSRVVMVGGFDEGSGKTDTPGRVANLRQGVSDEEAPSTPFKGSLALQSGPQGARAFVDGKPVGSTPVFLTGIPAGSRVVRLEAEGYQTWSAAIRVIANEQTQVSARLYREPPRP